MLLSEVRSQYKKIVIQLNINTIDDIFLNEFIQVLQATEKGKTELHIHVFSDEPADKNLKCEMVSKKLKIYLSNEFIEYLKNNEIAYHL